MVAAYTNEKWRARAFGVRYVVSFSASACSVPLVAYVYGATGDFKYLFFVLAALACLMLAAAVCMPVQVQRRAATYVRRRAARRGSRNWRGHRASLGTNGSSLK